MDKSIKIVLALISVVAIIGISMMLVSAVASNDEELEAQRQYHLTRAEQLLERGIYLDAVNELNLALRVIRDNDPNILFSIAETYFALFQEHRSERDLALYRDAIQAILDNGVPPDGMSIADLYYEHAIPHDMANSRIKDVIALLESSWRRTQDDRIFKLYQEHRYNFTQGRNLFGYAAPIADGSARVMCINELYWGFVNSQGSTIVSPQFDLATNLSGNFAVVKRDDVLQFVDRNGYRRVADLEIDATDLCFFDGSAFALSIRNQQGYVFAVRNDFMIDTRDTVYDFIGAMHNGLQVLQKDGKWQIFNRQNSEASTGFIFDGIAVDELGRAVIGDRFFAVENGQYYLMSFIGEVNETPQKIINESFDEARPFFEPHGLAAVRRGNKWGFVNTDGEVVIPFIYDDARSSSFGFASVMEVNAVGDELWGYITLEQFPDPWSDNFGTIVIEPQFLNAKQFVNGVAPVQMEHGWVYISLIAYS